MYDKMAEKMTSLENHRTQSEYDRSLTIKLYLLQFINFYCSIFYIAFFQGNLASIPGEAGSSLQVTGVSVPMPGWLASEPSHFLTIPGPA